MALGRKTGGRVKGTPNKATAEKLKEIKASGLSPLDYMLGVLRDPETSPERRDEMAKAAAPYMHPRLSTVTQTGLPFDPSKLTDDELEFFERVAARLGRAGNAGGATDGAPAPAGTARTEDNRTQH